MTNDPMNNDPPFEPETGNPETHDYLDWYRHLLRLGKISPSPAEKETHPAAQSQNPEAPGGASSRQTQDQSGKSKGNPG
jgi:hypothetical protein